MLLVVWGRVVVLLVWGRGISATCGVGEGSSATCVRGSSATCGMGEG